MHRARVTALEVVSPPAYSFAGVMTPALGETINVMLEQANERVSQLPGVDATAVYGLAGEELAAFGDEVDLLVVGSRSYGPWRRLVLGSTSNYLERHARCCLLVLPRIPHASDEASGRDGTVASAQTLTNPRSSA